MKSARIAVVGVGVMGQFHARSARRAPSTDLVVVADARPGVAEVLASELGCDAATDLESVFARRDLDGLVVATPVDTHVELVEEAARCGLGVLCEKPLASTVEGCVRAIDAAEHHGVPLQVGFHRRFDPDWLRLRRAVSDGELGEVYVLKSTLRDKTPPPSEYLRTSGGYFADAFVHDFDSARWLCGEVEAVTAVGVTATGPFRKVVDYDNAVVILEFASGALGVIDGSRVGGYGYDCTAELVGSRSTLRLANPWGSNVMRLEEGMAASQFPGTFLERFAAAYSAELEAFGTMLASGGVAVVDGTDALKALQLTRAAEASAKRGEKVRLADITIEA